MKSIKWINFTFHLRLFRWNLVLHFHFIYLNIVLCHQFDKIFNQFLAKLITQMDSNFDNFFFSSIFSAQNSNLFPLRAMNRLKLWFLALIFSVHIQIRWKREPLLIAFNNISFWLIIFAGVIPANIKFQHWLQKCRVKKNVSRFVWSRKKKKICDCIRCTHTRSCHICS